ncbi:hypothetical protein HYU11_01255 [Candidatus Woesearchaeota archaeon]|nr:hypothetical protein [Candidatus Woesearchaeota archaeon]
MNRIQLTPTRELEQEVEKCLIDRSRETMDCVVAAYDLGGATYVEVKRGERCVIYSRKEEPVLVRAGKPEQKAKYAIPMARKAARQNQSLDTLIRKIDGNFEVKTVTIHYQETKLIEGNVLTPIYELEGRLRGEGQTQQVKGFYRIGYQVNYVKAGGKNGSSR